jgi:hypothetical protein
VVAFRRHVHSDRHRAVVRSQPGERGAWPITTGCRHCASVRFATGNARIQRWVHTGFNPAVGSAAEVFVKRSDAALRDRMPVTLRSRPGIAIAMRTYEAARDPLTSQQKAYKLGSIVSPRIHGRGCWGSRVETVLLAALHVFSHAPYLVGRVTRVATLVGRCGGAPME